MNCHFILFLGNCLLCTSLIHGCKPDTLRPDELLSFIRDPRHGLVQISETGNWQLQFQYKPPAAVALISLEGSKHAADFERELQNSTGFWDFELIMRPSVSHSIEAILPHSADSLETTSNHLAFGMQNNISLWVNGDSIPCTFYHLQPIGKVDNAFHVLLSFERPQSISDWRQDLLIVLDEPLFGTHPNRFHWSKNDLYELPKLDYIQ